MAEATPADQTACKNAAGQWARAALKRVAACVCIAFGAGGGASDPYGPAPDYDSKADWCTADLPYSMGTGVQAPGGIITQVGTHFFRTCQGGHDDSTPERRVMRFFYNPERVEGLTSRKVMSGLMINNLATWTDLRDLILGKTKPDGEVELSGVPYEVHRYVDKLNGQLIHPYFVYRADALNDPTLPPHSIFCWNELENVPTMRGSCFLQVGYEDILANLHFISLGTERERIPIDRFPDFARDVLRALKTADVTDDLERYRGVLPLLDEAR